MAILLSPKQASVIMIVLLSAVIIFHILILSKIIPYTMVWAGRLKTDQEMYAFETISILINILLLFTILQKANFIKKIFSKNLLNIILWIFVIIFALNTLGNLFAKNIIELILGTALTAISSFLCWLIVRNKEEKL